MIRYEHGIGRRNALVLFIEQPHSDLVLDSADDEPTAQKFATDVRTMVEMGNSQNATQENLDGRA